MTTPTQHYTPTMFYPLNPCGHLRGPGLSCIGFSECKREPVSANKLGELTQRARDLHARLAAHPSRAATRDQPSEARTLVTDKLESVVSLAEFLSVMMISLCDDRAIMTEEEQATLATIGANVEMRVRDLQDFLTIWTGGGPS
ncbi:hypothetical protein [Stigmatella hybrida]|uniref:hypothetical protein n=1 Tax=Stigmatella hybrida TaxID=394097 RepID=UPI001CDACF14|nr:hypothetical protein [Stigmatella hybrida]